MTEPPQRNRVISISSDSMRRIYNKSQYPDMIARTSLTREYLRDSHLKNPKDYQGPYCTRSQTIRYYDANGQWVLEAHQYLRPDGTLGASGRQDPKRLRIGSTIYITE